MLKKIASTFAVAALAAAPLAANAQEAASTKLGVDTSLDLVYASPSCSYDEDGTCNDFVGYSISTMMVDLGVGYDFQAMVPGLYAGLDLPVFVQNKTSPDSGDALSQSGLGEASLYARYLYPVMPEMLKVGAQLRFKAGTGKGPIDVAQGDADAVTGSGFHNLQASLLAKGMFSGVDVDLELGYLMTMGKNYDIGGFSTDVNMGDFMYANLAVGYMLMDMIEPRLMFFYASQGENEVSALGATAKTDGMQYMGLAFDVLVKINAMFDAHVAFGLPTTSFYGNNLPYGFILSGKNGAFGGGYGFTVGGTAHF